MKKILFIALMFVCSLSYGQTISFGTGLMYGNGTPSFTPASKQSRFWYDLDNGNFWKWDGTMWVLVASASGADNWGTQVAITNLTMEGDGTSGNPLGVDTSVIATQNDLDPFIDSVRVTILEDSIIVLYEDGVEVDRDTIRGSPWFINDASDNVAQVGPGDTVRLKNGVESDPSNDFEVGLGGTLNKNTTIQADSNAFTFNQINQAYLQTNEFAWTLFPFFPRDSFSWRMWSLDAESNRSVAGVSEGMAALGSTNAAGQKNVFLGDPDGAFVYADDGFWILSPLNDTSSFIRIDTAMVDEISETAWLIGINPDSTLYRVPWSAVAGGSNNIISSDTPLNNEDSLRRASNGGFYGFDRGLNAEKRLAYETQIDSVTNILNGDFELGKYIFCIENDARYLISADTFPGVTVDSLTAIPVANNNYAILAPQDGFITPQNFKGYPNDLNADDVAMNAMFTFLGNINLPDNDLAEEIPVTSPLNVRITGGNFIVSDTVFLPQDYNVSSDRDYPVLRIEGYGGTIYCATDSIVMLFHGGKNGSDFTTLDRGDYSVYLEGLTLKAGGPDSTAKSITGIFFGAMDYFTIEKMKINNMGTGINIANSYGGRISEIEMQGMLHRGIYVQSGTLWDNVANPCGAGNTEMLVEKCRVRSNYSATQGQMYAQFEFDKCSGLTVRNCIAEGPRPKYNMIITYNGNSCTNPTVLNTIYFENATHPTYPSETDTCTNIWLRALAYETYMDNVYFNFSKPDTLIRSDSQGNGFLHLRQVNLPYSASFATPGFVLTDGTEWREVILETERAQDVEEIRDFCVAAFSNFDHTAKVTVKTPGGTFRSGGYSFGDVGLANDDVANSGILNIAGNVLFSTLTNKNYFGMRGGSGGLSHIYRPTAIGVGDEGVILNWPAKIGWDQRQTINLDNSVYPTPEFHLSIDTTGRASDAITQNFYINPRNANGEFRLYRNGYLKLEGYGSSFDMSAGTLGKTIQHYTGWDTDGGLIHIPTIPATDITSIGDSSTVAEEITGFDARLDSLEAASTKQYAEYGLTSPSDNMAASTSYGDISHSSNWIDGDTTSLLSHTDGLVTYSGTLTKKFKVDCSGTVGISESTQTVTVAPVQNGTVQSLNEVTVRNGGGNWPTPVTITAVITLANSETFKLQWKASGTTGTVIFNHMTCVLTQLD